MSFNSVTEILSLCHKTSHKSQYTSTGTYTTKQVCWVRFFNSQNKYLFSHWLHQLRALCTADVSGCTPAFHKVIWSLRSLFFTTMKEHIEHYWYLYEAIIYVSTTIVSWNHKQKELANYWLCPARTLNSMGENPLYCETKIWANFLSWECTDLALIFKV